MLKRIKRISGVTKRSHHRSPSGSTFSTSLSRATFGRRNQAGVDDLTRHGVLAVLPAGVVLLMEGVRCLGAAQVLQSVPADRCNRPAGRCSRSCGRSGLRMTETRRGCAGAPSRCSVGRPSAATARATTLRAEEALPKRSAVAKVEHHAALDYKNTGAARPRVSPRRRSPSHHYFEL